MSTAKNINKGFTIIELLIATTVFSIILLLASTGVIQVGRLYYKGITISKTQETARSITDEITRTVQLTSSPPTPPVTNPGTGTQSICIGVNRYTFALNQKIDNSGPHHALWLDTDRANPEAPCGNNYNFSSQPEIAGSSGRELLSTNMRLLDFQIIPQASNTTKVVVRVAYGENDLLDIYENDSTTRTAVAIDQGQCKSNIPGSSFCAVSGLDTVVHRRIIN